MYWGMCVMEHLIMNYQWILDNNDIITWTVIVDHKVSGN